MKNWTHSSVNPRIFFVEETHFSDDKDNYYDRLESQPSIPCLLQGRVMYHLPDDASYGEMHTRGRASFSLVSKLIQPASVRVCVNDQSILLHAFFLSWLHAL